MRADSLFQAREHVRSGRQIVARQSELIRRIRVQGRDPKEAEDLLSRFEASLRIFEEDLAHIEKIAEVRDLAPTGGHGL